MTKLNSLVERDFDCAPTANELFIKCEGAKFLTKLDLTYKCGVQNYITTRIYNGGDSRRNEYPWLAIVQRDDSQGRTFNCGGSLINNFYVLTAAHCLPQDTQSVIVFLGMHDKRDLETGDIRIYTAQNIKIHWHYKNISSGSDIALIKLSEEVRFSHTVRPICLPENEWEMTESYFLFAGWGRTEHEKEPNSLKHTRLSETSKEECSEALNVFSAPSNLLPLVICAHDSIGVPCKGDSGGPIMSYIEGYNRFLVQAGLNSFGGRCPDPNDLQFSFNFFPVNIFTKITPFLNWIYSNTQDSVYCVRPDRY